MRKETESIYEASTITDPKLICYKKPQGHGYTPPTESSLNFEDDDMLLRKYHSLQTKLMKVALAAKPKGN